MTNPHWYKSYKKKTLWQFNGLVYKKIKWLTRSRDIFRMAIFSFIFNVETSSLKRWKP